MLWRLACSIASRAYPTTDVGGNVSSTRPNRQTAREVIVEARADVVAVVVGKVVLVEAAAAAERGVRILSQVRVIPGHLEDVL